MFQSPIKPVKLGLDDTFQFRCHKDIACFNKCCQSIDIVLTPYDMLRLKRRLKMTSQAFIEAFTIPFEMDHHGMPGLKLRPRPGSTACPFVTEEGCSVYEDRPTACRYYALGHMGMRKKDASTVEDIYFLVKEDHCLGHQEPRTLTIREYRKEQGVEIYDEMNRPWRDIIIKKRSCGPTIGRPSERSFRLFYLASYDVEGFRRFVMSEGFKEVFDLDEATLERLAQEDEALLEFAARFLKQVLFGEFSIPRRPDALEKRLAKRRARLLAQSKEEDEVLRHLRYEPEVMEDL
ncbi:MAG: YkgJ family cysteine cluster protein [Gammaproteobacteria bacterium]|nr:MAG: YkgJ family cysteine cluster protein [Gammaproteobacteria bacterium]